MYYRNPESTYWLMSPMTDGKAHKNEPITSGKTANHLMVLAKLNLFKYFHTGYCIKGLVMVAKFICQAKVESVHWKAKSAEFAIGFQLRKIELCKNAKAQNSSNKIHLFLGYSENSNQWVFYKEFFKRNTWWLCVL